MLSDSPTSTPEDPIAAKLDREIASLQAQITQLKEQRALQAATILSSRHTQQTLSALRAAAAQSTTTSTRKQTSSLSPTDLNPLHTHALAQTAHNTTNLYRTLSSITTFHLTDPDPHAVDNGHILGLRFDICIHQGKFTKPYYIMLNKPFGHADSGDLDNSRKDLLRIHRHTLPPCIPLSSLARRYLPHDKGAVSTTTSVTTTPGTKRQDLKSFARALRKELVSYHKRIATISDLRKEFALDEKPTRKGKERQQAEKVIADISAADAEARQLRIEWVDGRIGRVLISDEGVVRKCVVIGEQGRDRDVERRLMGVDRSDGMGRRVESVGERLREGMY